MSSERKVKILCGSRFVLN